ncbi:MAG: outer membrane lipoprotein-sorting protein [Candidatus Hydrogenedentes bacterium]|nr:outer membrane lipoprotein-sorting protein [Candidatus Hydrogenedentota bacterium]
MKKIRLLQKHSLFCLLIALCILMGGIAAEELSPEERGLQIAQAAWEGDTGYGDSISELYMTLRLGSGQDAKRELRIRTLEVSDRETRAMVIFDTPADVRGTALLSHSFTDKSDTQWLYLPEIRREKRIAGGGRSGPFMGSEFSFEDMSSQRVEKFTYKYIADEVLNGITCHVIERYPVEKGSGYTKQVAWLDTKHLRVQKVDYYDRRSELLKTLSSHGYEQHEEKYWRPTTMEMLNHKTGRSTLLEWRNTKFNNGFTTRDFEPNALRNAR